MGAEEFYDNISRHDGDGLTPEQQVEDIPHNTGTIGSHFLDKDPQTQKYFRMIRSWHNYERTKQAANREERMKDHDVRDGDQWDEDDKEEVEARGQKASVFNLVKGTCDWITGTEKRTKVDYAVLPRRKEEAKEAESKTKMFKYTSDVSKLTFARSAAFADGVISGLGWIDTGIRSDESDDPIYVRYEDWRNVWYDSHAKERDLSDGRYQFRTKAVDLDVAVAMFPDRADAIMASFHQNELSDDEYAETGINPEEDAIADQGDALDAGVKRDRVKLISCEYRVPAKVKIIRGKELGSINGSFYDEKNEGMAGLVESGHASLYDAIKMVMWKMIFVGNFVLQNRKRVYNHNHFSLVPFWGFRKKRDNSPYGAVRNMRDPQDDLNKRRSKALYILSTKQVIHEEDTIEDVDDFAEEIARPDGIAEVKKGALSGNKIQINEERGLAIEHVRLMEQDQQFIEATGGVTDENKGQETNATSGKAILARQEQGHVTTADLFDNYRYAFKTLGEIVLSLMEQFYSEEKTIRITGNDGQPEYVEINKPGQDGEKINDITSTQADFIIDAQEYNATVQLSMAERLGDMISKLPQEVSVYLVDLWIAMAPGLPEKEREVALERIRGKLNLTDPDEDPDDPKVKARKEAQAAEMEKQKAIEDRLIALEMALKEAEIKEKEAEAEKDFADADAKRAAIGNKNEEMRIKRAEVLDKIETREQQSAAEG